MTIDFLYYNQTIPNTIWSSRIYKTNNSITSKAVCSAMCTLSSFVCKFYVYIESSLTCHLGQQSSLGVAIVTPTAGSEIANVQIGSKGEHKKVADDKVHVLVKVNLFNHFWLNTKDKTLNTRPMK